MPPEDERQRIADFLWTYGEDLLAKRALRASDEDLARIRPIASKHAYTSDTPSGAGMLFAKAYALAAVEVFEGEARPLARTRRRAFKQSPYQ
jgi:hypothetical protein